MRSPPTCQTAVENHNTARSPRLSLRPTRRLFQELSPGAPFVAIGAVLLVAAVRVVAAEGGQKTRREAATGGWTVRPLNRLAGALRAHSLSVHATA